MQTDSPPKNPRLVVIILLIGVTLAALSPVLDAHFISFDDPGYVTQNPHIRSGLSLETLRWAFGATEQVNWHPLTWISHALDSSLFGADARYHHGMNLLIHLASSVLLFLTLERMTGARWQSAFVAAVFAIHPLHVESVAWIAERKDVLSGFLGIAAIAGYARYCRSGGAIWYGTALSLFALGLLAKPMLVTLPFVLLLLDYWPLGRFAQDRPRSRPQEGEALPGAQRLRARRMEEASPSFPHFRQLMLEKLPFFLLSIASSIVTFIVQDRGGSVLSLDTIPLAPRVENAIVSYVLYVRKAILPTGLAFFYPHGGGEDIALWQAGGAALLLILVTLLAWKERTRSPWLLVGWLWFAGTLVPVIGLVQAGLQSMADRYMYIPLVGLAIMAAWGIPPLFPPERAFRRALAVIVALALGGMSYGTYRTASIWNNSTSLYEHAIAVTSDNHVAQNNLGLELAGAGRHAEAISHFEEAMRIRPAEVSIRINLARSLAALGRIPEALGEYQWIEARVGPDADLQKRIGDMLSAEGRTREAAGRYRAAIELDPANASSHCALARLYVVQSMLEEGRKQCLQALALQPGLSEAHEVLGIIAGKQGIRGEAFKEFSLAIQCDSANSEAYNNLGILHERDGDTLGARQLYLAALRANPGDWNAHLNLGTSCARLGLFDEAAIHWRRAIEIHPGASGARENLVRLLLMRGRTVEATGQLREALTVDSNNAEMHLQYGRLLLSQGKTAEADSEYAKATQLAPQSPEARSALSDLRKMQRR